MKYIFVAAVTFLLCFLLDKGFVKLFRSKPQQLSGESVRLHKYYGVGALLLMVLGVAAIITGLSDTWLLTAGGVFLLLIGCGLGVHYLSFGVYYDHDTFVVTGFGKRSTTYRYEDIKGQQLYNSYGKILIELHMEGGNTVQLQANMIGVYPFMDKAYAAWVRQTGRQEEDCAFHDPDNSCWFPPMED